jgi:hypothetical protein
MTITGDKAEYERYLLAKKKLPDKEIAAWVRAEFGHLPKSRQQRIRADREYVRDFYEADGITPSAYGRALMASWEARGER